jgi:gas vesicle protein
MSARDPRFEAPAGRDPAYREEVIELDADGGAGAAEGDDPERIRRQIERTRADMSETIDAIQDRLNPERVADQVKEQVREATIGRAEHMVSEATGTMREAGYGIMDTIRENPVPAALAAIGLGWLWLKRPSAQRDGADGRRYGRYEREDAAPGRYGYGYRDYGYRASYGGYREQAGPGEAVGRAADRAQDAAGRAADTVQGAAGQASDRVQQAAGQAGERVQQAASRAGDAVQGAVGQVQDSAQQLGANAQRTAMRARYGLEAAIYENPLGMGAAALVAGLAVGLAAPSTDVEDQFMGDVRDRVLQQGQEKLQDTLEHVQHVAQRTGEAATQTAKDAAKQEGLTPS